MGKSDREDLQREAEKLERILETWDANPTISDIEIVEWLRRNSSKNDYRSLSEIAQAFNVDKRGISKRLPRMVRDGLIHGNHEQGYWA